MGLLKSRGLRYGHRRDACDDSSDHPSTVATVFLETALSVRQGHRGKYWGFRFLSLFIPTAKYFFPAYVYARRLDDLVDGGDENTQQREDVLDRHMRLLDAGEPICPQDRDEAILALLVEADKREFNGQLKRAMLETFSTFSFDLSRRGEFRTAAELDKYAETMGISYVSAISCLLRVPLALSPDALEATARAGCKTYMLRDYLEDWQLGLPSLPKEAHRPERLQECENAWFQTTCDAVQDDYERSFAGIAELTFLSRLVALQFLVPRYTYFRRIRGMSDPRHNWPKKQPAWIRLLSAIVALLAATPGLRRFAPWAALGNGSNHLKKYVYSVFLRVLAYWMIPILSIFAGFFYASSVPNRHALRPNDLLILLPLLGLTFITANTHVLTYDSSDREASAGIGKLHRYFRAFTIAFGIVAVALIAVTREWSWSIAVGFGYVVPLWVYQATLVSQPKAPADETEKRSHRDRLRRRRHRLTTPTLLAVYVPFLLGVALVLPHNLLMWLTGLLCLFWFTYLPLALRVDSSRRLLWSSLVVLALVVVTWFTTNLVWPRSSLEISTQLDLMAAWYWLYMSAFEFLGVTRYEIRREEEMPWWDKYASYSRSALIFLFVTFPLTYLADGFQSQYLILAATFSWGAWALWLALLPPLNRSGSPVPRRRLLGLKGLAYAVPIIIVLGRTRAWVIHYHFTLAEAIGFAAFDLALLVGVATLRGWKQILHSQKTDPRSLLLLGAAISLLVAVITPVLVGMVTARDDVLQKANLISVGLILTALASIGFCICAIFSRGRHFFQAHHVPTERMPSQDDD